MDNIDNVDNVDNVENVEDVSPVENEVAGVDTFEQEQMKYSTFRYGLGAVLAFFGFSSKTHRASKKRAKLVGDIVVYIVLLAGAFLMVYPFWWMIAGSFAYAPSNSEYLSFMNKLIWWPERTTLWAIENVPSMASVKGGLFYNYWYILNRAFDGSSAQSEFNENFSYWRAVINNLLYSVVPVVVGVITSASAAFAFSKINWIGRDAVFMFLLAAIMVPGASIMASQYALYDSFGWLDNWMVLTIPGMFGSIMTAFFIRQFLFGLPTSIIEAAKIDGAGYFRIFCSFILPLAMPAIMAQGLLSFMGCWNNYMGSYVFIAPKSEWINLPHAMYWLQVKNGDVSGDLIAASVLCVLPVMILFAIFQRQIISSLMLTGSKE